MVRTESSLAALNLSFVIRQETIEHIRLIPWNDHIKTQIVDIPAQVLLATLAHSSKAKGNFCAVTFIKPLGFIWWG
ncbi:hypothetical protein TI24_21770 (plasmid) [Vibrio vulnificus]|nr:hypothetical protein VVCECT4999_22915 [Vibrio vulnificus]EGQ9240217.1 hypothetical protein [Vibrio vulnificus]EGR0354123.1 hypothetical protein [Vibrio vulnificus]EGR0637504.1 hypothetical protein [Vibrio vulnificus]EGR0642070.1 hypothetical protein [Vibrio vulnificus]